MARYSASADDLEMVVCFLAFHETKESPKKIQDPMVERRESGQTPWLESENVLRWS